MAASTVFVPLPTDPTPQLPAYETQTQLMQEECESETEVVLSEEERLKIPTLAREAYILLYNSSVNKMMNLGDYIADLRDYYDLRVEVVDAVVVYMTSYRWVQLWRSRDTEESWISVIVDSGSGGGGGISTQASGGSNAIPPVEEAEQAAAVTNNEKSALW